MNESSRQPRIGLQLFTLGQEMESDPAGTLERIAQIGYSDIETSPLSKLSAKETKRLLDDVGLSTTSGHCIVPDLIYKLGEKIEAAHTLGQQYIIVAAPWVADPSPFMSATGGNMMAMFLAILKSLTLDDWKWNAEQLNKAGEEIKKAGLQLGYHNHNFEFRAYGGVTGYDVILQSTDPELVKLELDAGWMTIAGEDPLRYLKQYPDRYRLLHIRDFKPGFTPVTTLGEPGSAPPVAPMGTGVMNYPAIFAAAPQVDTVYVEDEPPFTEASAFETVKVSYEYLNNLFART